MTDERLAGFTVPHDFDPYSPAATARAADGMRRFSEVARKTLPESEALGFRLLARVHGANIRDAIQDDRDSGVPVDATQVLASLPDYIRNNLGPPYQREDRWYAAWAHGHSVELSEQDAKTLASERAAEDV